MLWAPAASAQSVTVISNVSAARNCSVYADIASKAKFIPSDAFDACTRALETGVLSKDDRAATLVNRGIVQVANEEYQGALKDYNAAMELKPELPEAYVSRGNLWFLAGNFDRAITDYDKALALNLDRSHIAFFNRGLARERQGNRDGAMADYQQALQLQPTWTLPQEKIARLNNPSPAASQRSPQ